MKSPLLLSATALLLGLAACNNEPETIVAGPADPMAEQMKNAAPVKLPPPVSASVQFRCKDNSLAFVDFFDGTFVNYRAEKDGAPVNLTAATPGGPYTADGYSITGDPKSITLTAPGKSGLSCRA